MPNACRKLRAFATGLGAQRLYASTLSIMVSKKVCYFYVRPRKTFLEEWTLLPRKIDGLKFMAGDHEGFVARIVALTGVWDDVDPCEFGWV